MKPAVFGALLWLALAGLFSSAGHAADRLLAKTDSRSFWLASAGVQAAPTLPDFLNVDHDLRVEAAEVVAVFQEYHGIPWQAFIDGDELPEAWVAEMDRLAEQAADNGRKVYLNLQLAGGTGRRHRPDKTLILDNGKVWKIEPYGPACPAWFGGQEADEHRQAWLAYLEWMIARFEPVWLNYALEIHFFKDCPERWPEMVAMTELAYDTARQADPDLIVFPSFSLDHLYGLAPDTCPDELSADACLRRNLKQIEAIPRDRLAISTYPYGHEFIDSPEDLPDDWLSRLVELTGERLVIAETGWPAHPIKARLGQQCLTVVDSDAQQQIAYFDWLVDQAGQLDVELLTWWSGHDLLPADVVQDCPCSDPDWCPLVDLFRESFGTTPTDQFWGEVMFKFWGTMGLFDHAGQPRDGLLERWQAERARNVRPPGPAGRRTARVIAVEEVPGQPFSADITVSLPKQNGQLPEVTIQRGQLGSLQTITPTRFQARITSDLADSEVIVTFHGEAAILEHRQLFFGQRDQRWGLAEAVPGAVNTPGWEDSAEVSPDGEWLIVGTTSPVDLFGCLLDGTSADAARCSEAIGPWRRPKRPLAPGADRVDHASGQIVHAAPALCLDESVSSILDLALPPVSAYAFRKLPDGRFGRPQPIHVGVDGAASAPFGFSFVGSPTQRQAEVVFAFPDPARRDEFGDASALYVTTLALDRPNLLGRYECQDGEIVQAEFDPQALPLPMPGRHRGNPYLEATRVWFDDELAETSRIHYIDRGPDGQWLDERLAAAPVNLPGQASYQPHHFDQRLYIARDFRTIESFALNGPPDQPASWSSARIELGLTSPGDEPGQIVAIGEPSRAVDRLGRQWLYFVYVLRTDTGYQANIGRSRAGLPQD